MRRNFFVFAVMLCSFFVVSLCGNAWSAEEGSVDYSGSIMRPDRETLLQWIADYENAPPVDIDQEVHNWLSAMQQENFGTSLTLLSYVPYTGPQRNQANCGNCWVWAGTGLMEIEHNVQNSVSDRLSIQYLDSCKTDEFACDGGNLTNFVSWYVGQGRALPWSNTNASFADGSVTSSQTASSMSCGNISTSPNYFLSGFTAQTIATTGTTTQAQAILNIKNVLNQNKGVQFSYFLANKTDWNAFQSFWNSSAESVIWNPDNYCGHTWNNAPGEGGGHAVIIVGYNDDDANPDNHYWIVLNSWGINSGRPTGLFRMKMNMDYSCFLYNTPTNFYNNQFQSIAINFGETDDPYEDNDTLSTARGISFPFSNSSLKSYDEDWYKVYLGAVGETIDVTINFTHANGDLDLELYNSSGTRIDYSISTSNQEFVSYTISSSGYYYIKVFGYQGATNSYSMNVNVYTTSLPDLQAPRFNWKAGQVFEGDPFWVQAYVYNAGLNTAGASHVKAYLSIDNDYDVSDDYYLGEKAVSALSSQTGQWLQWDFAMPNMLSGKYNVWVVTVVDSRNEVSEGNDGSANIWKTTDVAFVVSDSVLNVAPTLGTLTPATLSSAVNVGKTFSAVYSDGNGYGDLNVTYLLINTSVNGANAIYVRYNRAGNKLYLRNDAGTADVGSCTPGVAGTLTNTKGTLNCATTTVSGTGSNVTVNWNITPKAAFAGTKNIYMYASDNVGATAGWTDKGDWAITAANVAPTLGTLTPATLSSAVNVGKTFSAVYSDGNGYGDLNVTYLLINTSVNGANAIYVRYNRAGNKLYLRNDAGTADVGSCTPGTAGTLTNSQGSLNCAATTVSGTGSNVTVNWNITPKAAFTGTKNIYMYASDNAGATAGWTDKGNWTITATNVAPTLGTLTSSVVTSASGIAKTFSAVYSDANGYADLNQMDLLINTTVNAANGIYVIYDRATNKIFLINDAGTAGVGSCTPGVAGTLTNTKGTLNCGTTTVSGTGNNLTVNWNITPKAAFTGTKNIYMYASDKAGATAGWTDKGDWTITAANVAPTLETLTPLVVTSAPGIAKTFSAVYSDANGYADLNQMDLLINTTVNAANGIYVIYDRATNKIFLINDAGTAGVGSCTPGVAGTLTNTKGTLNCGTTTVSGTGNNLTVNWNITPKAAFAGTKNIYMYASDKAGAMAGWTDKGDWTISASSTVIGTWTLMRGCTNASSYTWYINSNGTFSDNVGTGGTWTMNGNQITLYYNDALHTTYSGTVSDSTYMSGTVWADTLPATCWYAYR